jgi:aminopeptidase N
VPAGKATLSIAYTGILNGELRGFYLSKTERRRYAVTQFEPTDARRAFPSFDEPAFKASFDVSLVADAGDTAISNGPIVSDTPGPGDGKHTIKFLTSPRMSTYLVAFLVGDFAVHGGRAGWRGDPRLRDSRQGCADAVRPGCAKYILHYYNNYFGIPYPLEEAGPDCAAGL